jgi:hypothetical protein
MSRPDLAGQNGWIARTLFAPVDPIPSALFRIALAGLVVVAFWPTPWPLPAVVEANPILRGLYDTVFATVCYWAIVATVAALLALGVRPRLTGAVLGGLLLPLVPLQGSQPGRQVLAITVLAFSFLRSDAALAVAVGRRPDAVSAGPSWPIRIIQLQLSVLYLANAIVKTTPDYLSGQTLAVMSQSLPNFLVRPSDGHIPLGGLSIPLWLAATGVVITEYALAAGFWFRRTRMATALLGVAFHTALRSVIRIAYLDVVALLLYAAFLLPFEGRSTEAAARRCEESGVRSA